MVVMKARKGRALPVLIHHKSKTIKNTGSVYGNTWGFCVLTIDNDTDICGWYYDDSDEAMKQYRALTKPTSAKPGTDRKVVFAHMYNVAQEGIK